MKKALRIYDPWLFALAAIATCMGLVFIFDAGYARALQTQKGGMPPEFRQQLVFLFFAAGATWLAASVRADQWKKWSKLAWIVNLFLLIAVLVFGHQLNGAKRWIGVGTYLIQPAEFAKLAAVIYLAGYFAVRRESLKKAQPQKSWDLTVKYVWMPAIIRCLPAIWVFLGVSLIEIEPDMGTGAVIAATGFAMFFPAGVSRKSILIALSVAVLAGTVAVIKEPYRLQRFLHHNQRWTSEYYDDLEFQTVQAELAIASGGVPGVGLGAGRAKHVLPATTTDYVMATVGEETGLWGSMIVLTLLGAIVFRLVYLAGRAKNRFDMLLLYGVGFWIGIQTCVNVMMANAFLPAIGIPLPFISSGGSSLVALWLALGACQSTLAPAPEKQEQETKHKPELKPSEKSAGPRLRNGMPASTSLNRLNVTTRG